jgi:Ser/Thr protein kinase RdoA (MazF antagonist)
MEAIRPVSRWPWVKLELAGRVLTAVAGLHALPLPDGPRTLVGWDYESDLETSAAETLAVAERVLRQPPADRLKGSLRPLRRLVGELPAIRRELRERSPLPAALLHGDLHPGNVMIRRRAGRDEVVLIDWARARIGSPLEDVASWLQSLGFFLPEARRRHDTLFAGYLADRGFGGITREFRMSYWYAAASNALAGALRYHLSIVADAGRRPAARQGSLRSAADWLRILRRADATWRQAAGRSRQVPPIIEDVDP